MKQFMDIFSLPEMSLLSCVNDFFMKHNIDYEPVHLHKDVKVKRPPPVVEFRRQAGGRGGGSALTFGPHAKAVSNISAIWWHLGVKRQC